MVFWLCPRGGDLAYSLPTLNPMQGGKQNKKNHHPEVKPKDKNEIQRIQYLFHVIYYISW